MLTEYLDWRWTFFVNIPFALVAAAGACFVIREPAGGRNRRVPTARNCSTSRAHRTRTRAHRRRLA
ncbi:hypothetical protein A4E84_36715 [Streptomyces qaidamensis]|uniref:Major facilitator superfamily (MFS) profile domain-containing protein n=1 Tax=Streptomyces qaidamensis TaxID=1783515 RepID=A0A143CBC3_9ACTN|nr:hypothetical protein A4E84_36715 [Streptomyces qaidamensis]